MREPEGADWEERDVVEWDMTNIRLGGQEVEKYSLEEAIEGLWTGPMEK